MSGTSLSIKNEKYVLIDGIPVRLYVREQFSINEIEAIAILYPTLRRYSKGNMEKEISFFEDTNNLHTIANKGYAVVLALFQRIRLPFEFICSNPISNTIYAISDVLPNFQKFNKIFEEIYSRLYPFREKQNTESFEAVYSSPGEYKGRKYSIYYETYRAVLRLWLEGYGLTREYGLEPMSLSELLKIYESSWPNRRNTVVKILNHILLEFKDSIVKDILPLNEKKSITEVQENSWNLLERTAKSEIFDELKSFMFDVTLARTKAPYELEFIGLDGNTRTEIFSKIEISTWRDKTNGMLTVVKSLSEKGILTIDEALNGGFQEIIADITEDLRSRISVCKTSISEWLKYYSIKNKKNIKISKVIPNTLGRGEIKFGATINYSAATELIETLLDDQSPYHDDNFLSQFRCRRACLLLLESAARIHEVTILKQKCIKTNKFGDKFLYIHKTKNGNPRTAPISEEGELWVKQLLEFAPNRKIFIEKDKYGYGDGKNEFRLFANYLDDAPLTPNAVSSYLRNLQKKMWKDNPKGGRYFSPHDIRRMCAVYMKMVGLSDEEVKERLGQENIKSQIPYLFTKPISHLKHFKAIYDQGLWSNKISLEDDSQVNYEQTAKLIEKEKDTKLARSIIETFTRKFNEIELPTENYLPETEAAGGYPIYSHNCVAKCSVTCHHTELKCFGCDYYNPDSNMLLHHKAEILRWIIFLYHNLSLKKLSKNAFDQHKITARTDDVEENLKVVFKNLFKKFDLDEKEVKKVEIDLYVKAKKYMSKYGKIKPSPTFSEALDFYREGVLIG